MGLVDVGESSGAGAKPAQPVCEPRVCEPRGQAIVYESYKRMLKIERSALSVSSSKARKVRSADGKYDS